MKLCTSEKQLKGYLKKRNMGGFTLPVAYPVFVYFSYDKQNQEFGLSYLYRGEIKSMLAQLDKDCLEGRNIKTAPSKEQSLFYKPLTYKQKQKIKEEGSQLSPLTLVRNLTEVSEEVGVLKRLWAQGFDVDIANKKWIARAIKGLLQKKIVDLLGNRRV